MGNEFREKPSKYHICHFPWHMVNSNQYYTANVDHKGGMTVSPCAMALLSPGSKMRDFQRDFGSSVTILSSTAVEI